MAENWPADKIERRKVTDLTPYARNSRTHSDEQVAQIAASIKEWGFTNPVLIDSEGGIIAGHGRVMAAQRRERVFFCAIRDDIAAPPLQLAPKHRWVSAGEATDDLQALTKSEFQDAKMTEMETRFWRATKPGSSFAAACKKLTGREAWFSHVRLAKNMPSCTLTANHNDFKHWDQERRLTFKEAKRLGSFPDDYQAKSDKIGKYMIGMSVPPKMTEQVARAVIDQWLQPKETN